MKVDHIFGGQIYLISSYGVARNPILKDDEDLRIFKTNVHKYLGDICEIYAYSHQINQFQYLVRILERPKLEAFFYNKKIEQARGKKDVSHKIYDSTMEVPPESYLIFSQEVSNCLNSYAKKFNFRHKRIGGLFADRYCKELVENESEMQEWIVKLNSKKELINFVSQWAVKDVIELADEGGESSSAVSYEGGEGVRNAFFDNFIKYTRDNLRGCFDCLPPSSIKAPNYLQKLNYFIKIKGTYPPW